MSSILDIVASLTLRTAIVIAILNMTISLQGKLSEKTVQANIFNLTTIVARVISNDCNMVGYQVSPPYFTSASSDTIELTYKDPSTNAQTWVKYFAGPTSELVSTNNPYDRKLYKAQGGAGAGVATANAQANGVVKLNFTYFDSTGATTSIKNNIKSFSVYLVIASGDSVNHLYPSAEWTYRFFPSNIN